MRAVSIYAKATMTATMHTVLIAEDYCAAKLDWDVDG